MCMAVLSACMSVHHLYAWGIRFLRTNWSYKWLWFAVWVLWRPCSWPLSYLSSSCSWFFDVSFVAPAGLGLKGSLASLPLECHQYLSRPLISLLPGYIISRLTQLSDIFQLELEETFLSQRSCRVVFFFSLTWLKKERCMFVFAGSVKLEASRPFSRVTNGKGKLRPLLWGFLFVVTCTCFQNKIPKHWLDVPNEDSDAVVKATRLREAEHTRLSLLLHQHPRRWKAPPGCLSAPSPSFLLPGFSYVHSCQLAASSASLLCLVLTESSWV